MTPLVNTVSWKSAGTAIGTNALTIPKKYNDLVVFVRYEGDANTGVMVSVPGIH